MPKKIIDYYDLYQKRMAEAHYNDVNDEIFIKTYAELCNDLADLRLNGEGVYQSEPCRRTNKLNKQINEFNSLIANKFMREHGYVETTYHRDADDCVDIHKWER